ncbi:unnamed protein product [Brugia timori]|uniref:Uncharacterized protein n=1 Tax=Brugia timori TaxID=42155 RepID=A0A0R3QMN1_9BILA|nr:unnamed protein product [Brugia timori]
MNKSKNFYTAKKKNLVFICYLNSYKEIFAVNLQEEYEKKKWKKRLGRIVCLVIHL